ncbi:hypothetical protein CDD80_6444 [Ophiocordyceps camponoti-rufipedis]|uniref:Phenylalanine--tRNA ligase, mitochondrial n=1 Tax=Ophiocordyceps camponoti-rufipedis TaxID=2004952 RepID=A0A2C5YK38_9HYPO|nr:hypothetical protein CDD80_6444 [Ophiocordyceps camponoti-rufipedis]
MLSGAVRTCAVSGSRRVAGHFGCYAVRCSSSSASASVTTPTPDPAPAPASTPTPIPTLGPTPVSARVVEVRGRRVETDSASFNIPQNVLDATSRQLLFECDHPLDITRRLIELYFPKPAFAHYNDYHPVVSTAQNFDSLGFPPDHPGRARTDTYYFNDGQLLRTHTSAHQAEAFAATAEDQVGYIISADVYRRDEVDRKHYPIFHQMEGARWWDRNRVPGGDVAAAVRSDVESLPRHKFTVEDETTPFRPDSKLSQHEHHSPAEVEAIDAHLKLSLENALGGLFSRARRESKEPLRMRWVDAYFPFTHPSWELEVLHNGDWVEVLGCGVVQHRLHAAAGTPSRLGWAFGLGLDRIAMLLFRIPDIRALWSTDKRLKSQFRGMSQHLPNKLRPFRVFSKHPPSPRDISFWLPQNRTDLPDIDVVETVRSVGGDLVEEVGCIDRFVHPTSGRHSKAFHIVYRSLGGTLHRDVVKEVHNRVTETLEKRYGVEMRGYAKTQPA